MNDIISTIDGLEGLVSLRGASKETIIASEQRLGVGFAEDYTAYLEKYGVISARHIELTGIIDSNRLNVVDVTLEERQQNQLPQDLYVIEDSGIEGILIVQNRNGEIFEWQNRRVKKLYGNLSDYLLSK
jgi:hypothetical protein